MAFGARRTKLNCCREHICLPNYSWADMIFQVPWIVKFRAVHVEQNYTNYFFNLFGIQRALEWVVKKPLGRVQKAGDYLLFLS